MKILGMDTSGSTASVAVIDDTTLLGEYSINHKKTHSQKLMPMLDELLRSLALKPGDLDAFAISIGPGSFTGLRIGIATIKGIAHPLDKPVLSVPTLDGLAFNIAGYDGLICPIIDARNDNVYTAIYKYNKDASTLSRKSEYMALHINDLLSQFKNDEKVMFLGDTNEKFKSIIQDKVNNSEFAPIHLALQKASSIAFAGLEKFKAGQIDTYSGIKPLYVRPSQAERLCQ